MNILCKIKFFVLIMAVVTFVHVKAKQTEAPLGFGSECIIKSRKCTERRILNLSPTKQLRAIFQDALYHYCLNLMGCETGKEQVCSNVGKSELEYPDPNLRRQLVKQCNGWKIPVKTVETGSPTAHYIFFRDIKSTMLTMQ